LQEIHKEEAAARQAASGYRQLALLNGLLGGLHPTNYARRSLEANRLAALLILQRTLVTAARDLGRQLVK
jgi:hypothetical protein